MHTCYKELDDAILAHIGGDSRWLHPTYSISLLSQAAREIGLGVTEHDERTWRLISRRLQILKKSGRIRYERKKWMLLEA